MSKKSKQKKSDIRRQIERVKVPNQIYGAASYGYYINTPNPTQTIREQKILLMRRYPTITYLTQLITIAGDTSEWTVEADERVPWEAVNMVQGFIDRCKLELWRTAIDGWICYGNAVYEKELQVLENEEGHARIVVRRLHHLLNNTFNLEFDSDYGFLGIRTFAPRTEWICRDKALVLTHDKLGDDLNGRSLLKNAEFTYDAISDTWQNMRLYSRKVSNGPKYKILYPEMTVTGPNGEKIRTADKAKELASTLEDNGVALLGRRPNTAAGQMSATDSDWDIQTFPTETMSGAFIEELMYQDKCLCRAFGVPERSVIEGMFSTRADSGNATEFTLLRIHYLTKHMVDQITKYVVNPMMTWNYEGLEDRIRIKAGEIDREAAYSIQQFVLGILESNEKVQKSIDMDALIDKSKLPRLKENEVRGQLKKPFYDDAENERQPYNIMADKGKFTFEVNDKIAKARHDAVFPHEIFNNTGRERQ